MFLLVDILIALGFLFPKHNLICTNLVTVKTYFLNNFFALLRVYIFIFLKIRVPWKYNFVGHQVATSSFQGVFHKETTKGYLNIGQKKMGYKC